MLFLNTEQVIKKYQGYIDIHASMIATTLYPTNYLL